MSSFLNNTNARVYVAGHRGLIGSAIIRKLQTLGFNNLVLRTHEELDLINQDKVFKFFEKEKPDYVFLAAARVGGIKANADHLAEFLYENLSIQCNVIKAAAEHGVKKLLFLGSSCIYPKHALQPMKEEYLLTGPLEPSNEGYALAKIAGLKLCEYLNRQRGHCFISAMPTNLYGPYDNYDPIKSHVIPGLLVKFHRALKEKKSSVELWGTGSPYREFLHSDDCADALIMLMDCYNDAHTINVGTGQELTVKDLATKIAHVTGFTGNIVFNAAYPDGTPRKLLDVSKIFTLGWKPRITLDEGLKSAYAWAVTHNKLH